MAYTNPVTHQTASSGTLNSWLRSEKHYLADYIVNDLSKQGFFIYAGNEGRQKLLETIAQSINDWTHES